MKKKTINNTQSDYTICLTIIGIVIAITSKLSAIGVSGFGMSIIQAVTVIGSSFLLFASGELKISTNFLLLILISVILIFINQSPEMISSTMILIISLLVSFYSKSINYTRILKIYFITNLVLFCVILFAYVLFHFNHNDYLMWRANSFVYRRSIGFLQPNIADMQWLSIVLSVFGFAKDRKAYWLALVFTLLIYFQTKSRASTSIIVIAIFFLIVMNKKINSIVPGKIRFLISLMPIYLTLLSLYVTLSNKSFSDFNILLSGRLSLYKEYYNLVGFHFIGNPILDTAIFDNSYLQMLLTKGILYMSFIILIYTFIGNLSSKITWRTEIIFISLCLLAFVETSLQHFDLIFPLLLSVGVDINEID